MKTNPGCNIAGNVITIASPFDTAYTGGTEIEVRVNGGTNPLSVTTPVNYRIETLLGGNVIDETDGTNFFTPVAGEITTGSTATSSSVTTYEAAVFTLSFTPTHIIPTNGKILITIPAEIGISNAVTL